MQWFGLLTRQKQPPAADDGELFELRTRQHRLEIALHELRERLDSLEGRHASLSASVRGRLGGRPKAVEQRSGAPLQFGGLPPSHRE
jgi:hypothetical protein